MLAWDSERPFGKCLALLTAIFADNECVSFPISVSTCCSRLDEAGASLLGKWRSHSPSCC